MNKHIKITCYIISFAFILSCNTKQNLPIIKIKKLDYPSASAVEYFDGKLYVMGDDAKDLLVLDTNFNIVESIPLFSNTSKRIPKETKPDLEASAFYFSNKSILVLFGSMSVSPNRDQCWLYTFRTGEIDSASLGYLHTKIKNSGIEQINIEGACNAFGYLVMANRGNKNYPKNYLIIGSQGMWKEDSESQINIIEVITKQTEEDFRGISGLCYINKPNKLIMSVSTEDTKNVYEDGAIGKSYLWIINDFSIKRENKTISPDRVIDLEEIDKRFKGYKIESVTVIGETNELLNLVLVADNDDGSSTIFKLSIKKD